MGTDYATLSITHDKKGYIIKQTEAINAINGSEEIINFEKRLKTNMAYFKIEVEAPDGICQFSYSEDGKRFKKIGKPFKAKPGKWIGAKVGLFSISSQEATRGGYADIDWFNISK